MGRKAALTKEQVRVIRLSHLTLKELAALQGVSILTVWKAKWGKPPYNHDGVYDTENTTSNMELAEIRTN